MPLAAALQPALAQRCTKPSVARHAALPAGPDRQLVARRLVGCARAGPERSLSQQDQCSTSYAHSAAPQLPAAAVDATALALVSLASALPAWADDAVAYNAEGGEGLVKGLTGAFYLGLVGYFLFKTFGRRARQAREEVSLSSRARRWLHGLDAAPWRRRCRASPARSCRDRRG